MIPNRLAAIAAGLLLSTGPLLAQPAARRSSAPLDLIQPEWISAPVRFLADRLLEGRETGERGAELAAKYVASRFEEIGLRPLGRDSSFLAPVPLRYSEPDLARTSLLLVTRSGARPLEWGQDYLVHADKVRESSADSGSIVFVGWGVTAASGYDDYRGLDVRGKFVAMLFGGPASLPPDERGHYAGLAMKERNARSRGAIGVITVMPTPGPVLADKLGQLEGFAWLDREGRPHSPFFEQGPAIRLTDRGAALLFEAAGRSLADVTAALAKGPASFPIDASFSLRAAFRHRDRPSPNVVGVIEGSDPKLRREYVVYSAHLDHVGVRTPVDGDSVYHGAIDNAGGTAVLVALARAYRALPPTRRSVIFLAVTGEEKGILGSDYFVHEPPVPLESIVADVNLDNFVMTGPIKDFVAYGAKYSTLSDDAARAFRRLGVGSSDDPLPGMTIFTRSDHYTFMMEGVPGLLLFPGKASGLETVKRWFGHVHHTPRDRIDQGIDWQAGVTYANANLLIGRSVADASSRPAWRGSFFFREEKPGSGGGARP